MPDDEDACWLQAWELAWVAWRLAAYLVVLAAMVVTEGFSAAALVAWAMLATVVVMVDTEEDTEDPVVTAGTVATADTVQVAGHASDAAVATRAGAVADSSD